MQYVCGNLFPRIVESPRFVVGLHFFKLIVDDGDFLNELPDVSCLPADYDSERQAERKQKENREEKHHIRWNGESQDVGKSVDWLGENCTEQREQRKRQPHKGIFQAQPFFHDELHDENCQENAKNYH